MLGSVLQNQMVSYFSDTHTHIFRITCILENFRVNGRYTLSSTNKLTLRFSATEQASFRCRVVKHSPPPPFTTAWIPCE